MGRQQTDKDIFAFEVSDEALEIAAGTENEKEQATLSGPAAACRFAQADQLKCTQSDFGKTAVRRSFLFLTEDCSHSSARTLCAFMLAGQPDG